LTTIQSRVVGTDDGSRRANAIGDASSTDRWPVQDAWVDATAREQVDEGMVR
jgi:hypothetical protein